MSQDTKIFQLPQHHSALRQVPRFETAARPTPLEPKNGSRRSAVRPSAILRIWAHCKEVGGIDLATGIPSANPHQGAVDFAVDALRAGDNAYSQPNGVPELRSAIAEKLVREDGLAFSPEDEILVSTGVTGAIAASLMALFEPGDEILLPEPFFGWHANLIRIAGLTPRFVPLSRRSFELTQKGLREAVNARTRGLILCSPANPTGKVYSREELSRIRDVAQERDLVVITDEQYKDFRYDQLHHVPPAAIEGLRERTVSVAGFSKSLSMTGWRIGYAAGPSHWISEIQKVHQLLYICPPTPLQHGVAGALQSDAGATRPQLADLKAKRDELSVALTHVGFEVQKPSAGFFILAEAKSHGRLESWGIRDDLALALLERAGIAAVPGYDFFSGSAGDRMLRFCFAKSDAEIRAACHLLRSLRHQLSERIH